MKLRLGIKTDPIEYRYSFRWLFELMEELGVKNIQLGSFFEMYLLPDSYFLRLRRMAEDHGLRFAACFTAHRELGGFFQTEPAYHRVAYDCFSRYLEIGALLGAESVGSNPGAVMRDEMESKAAGIERYCAAVESLSKKAAEIGLSAITVEPMSSLAEPPTTPEEITAMMRRFAAHREKDPSGRVPVLLCGDVSHGLVDAAGKLVHTHVELLEMQLPWLWEFHFKNTDSRYSSTFGFGDGAPQGIVSLPEVRNILVKGEETLPRRDLVGYVEIGGPKLGRDYSDPLLRDQLVQSVKAIQNVFREDISE